MKIEILGTGCRKCGELYSATQSVLEENNITADLCKVSDIKQIMAYKVLMTPAIVIDGEVKIAGRVPDKKEIEDLVK